MKNALILALILLCIGLSGFFYMRLRHLEADILEERNKNVVLQEKQKAPQQATLVAPTPVQAAGNPEAPTRTASKPYPASPVANPRDPNLPVSQSRLERIRARTEPRYQPLLAKLGLSEAQSNAFLTMVVERRDAEAELASNALQRKEDPNTIEIKRRAAAFQEQLEENVRRQFGENALRDYRQYEWQLSAKDLVAAAASSLRDTAPLTPQQNEQLVGILSQQFSSTPGTGRPHDPVPYRITVDDQLIRIISTVANPTQMAPFIRIKSAQEKHIAGPGKE